MLTRFRVGWLGNLIWLACARLSVAGVAQQQADAGFQTIVVATAYAQGRGPRVLIDEAHSNYHTAGGRIVGPGDIDRRVAIRLWNEAEETRPAPGGDSVGAFGGHRAPGRGDARRMLETPVPIPPNDHLGLRRFRGHGNLKLAGRLVLVAEGIHRDDRPDCRVDY